MNFQQFNFHSQLSEGLASMGFENATPIQQQAIPVILEGKDMIACAQTGTGKTAAFLLPIINKLASVKNQNVDTLIVVPTRELAIQIDEAVQGFGYFVNISSLAIFGGNNAMSFEQEKKALSQGADIIIATPGRLISHLNLGYVNFSSINHFILDEADRMLDMGFSDDISRIVKYLPPNRQTLLFSATMPPKIRKLAQQLLLNPVQINIALSKPAEGLHHYAIKVNDDEKLSKLIEFIKGSAASSILIFAGKKDKVKSIERLLAKSGFNVASIHSDLNQSERNEVLRNYKNLKLKILVATDVLSRGIDIDSIGLVINFDVPSDPEDYVHRIGRTARAGNKGEAITFVNYLDIQKMNRIEKLLGKQVMVTQNI